MSQKRRRAEEKASGRNKKSARTVEPMVTDLSYTGAEVNHANITDASTNTK